MVSNFALCGMPFLAGFYSKACILEMFSMGYVNMFGFIYIYIYNTERSSGNGGTYVRPTIAT
jgi:NADH-ubiquinone oxidoreductase chain 5